MFFLDDNRDSTVYVFITEIIWQTFDVIIDVVESESYMTQNVPKTQKC